VGAIGAAGSIRSGRNRVTDKSGTHYARPLRDHVLSVLREPNVWKRLRLETDPHSIMQMPPERGQLMPFPLKALGVG
jgi:hypothetical protein